MLSFISDFNLLGLYLGVLYFGSLATAGRRR